MSRFSFFAALSLAAIPVSIQAQTPPPAAPAPSAAAVAAQAAIQPAANAFGECVSTGVQALAATTTPQAGASSVIAGCSAQRQHLQQVVEAFIATMPEAQRAAAQEHLRTGMAQIEPQVIAAIQQQRTAAAPAAAPAPAH